MRRSHDNSDSFDRADASNINMSDKNYKLRLLESLTGNVNIFEDYQFIKQTKNIKKANNSGLVSRYRQGLANRLSGLYPEEILDIMDSWKIIPSDPEDQKSSYNNFLNALSRISYSPRDRSHHQLMQMKSYKDSVLRSELRSSAQR